MKPDWAIKANGKDVTVTFKPYLLSIQLRDESKDEADGLTLVLDNANTALQAPVQGDELEVLLGYEGALVSCGKFTVDHANFSGPPDQVVIACKSAAFATSDTNDGILQSFLTRKTRSWEPSTLDAIAKKIAKEHGVELVTPGGLLLMLTPHLDQTEESDTGFLYRVIYPRGYIVKVADKKLIIARRSAGLTYNARTGESIKPTLLKLGEVSHYSGQWQERSVFTKAVAFWHDVATGQVRYETAGEGDRTFRFKSQAPDQKTAQDWATSVLKQSQGEGGKMAITLPGRADLQSEQLVTLQGFPYPLSASPTKSAIAKQWVLKSVEHVLNRSGFTTSITGEPFIQT